VKRETANTSAVLTPASFKLEEQSMRENQKVKAKYIERL